MHRLWVTGEVYEPLREANRIKAVAAQDRGGTRQSMK
jgi:hypothetical protein